MFILDCLARAVSRDNACRGPHMTLLDEDFAHVVNACLVLGGVRVERASSTTMGPGAR